MPHAPKPFYRTARGGWFVQLPSGQRRLTTGPKSAASHKEAWDAFHALMAGPAHPAAAGPGDLSLALLLDYYLSWVQAERSPRTYEWTLWHVQSFCDHLERTSPPDRFPAVALKPHHLVAWSQSRPTWGANQRRGAISCVQRAFA